MDYQETLDYMYSQLPMYQRIGRPAFKPDLSNSYKLMELLGHPEKKFKSIHIAGTNGKGSTANFLTSILMENGLKVGLYTSPHLKDFRERISISGTWVSKDYVIEFIGRYKEELAQIGCSFFEMTVGMAFAYFAEQKADVAIIEVGMGGRLDSTNVINPLLSVITNIGFDHTFFLGDTLEKIAGEKAGIIKPNTPVIIGKTQTETKPVFDKVANKLQCPIIYADQELTFEGVSFSSNSLHLEKVFLDNTLVAANLVSPLTGKYQVENLRIVVMTALFLTEQFSITQKDITSGINNVVRNTNLQGRWQKLADEPLTYCDTAHNEEGLAIVLQQLNELPKKQLHFVLGMVNDKNIEKILSMLPADATYYFCKADIPRGLNATELSKEAAKHHLTGKVFESVSAAYTEAQNQAAKEDVVFIGGSTFTVAEVL